jgi:hypothetical protein
VADLPLELQNPWRDISSDEGNNPHARQRLVDELRRELGPGHLLESRAAEAVAYRGDRDDVLFRLDGDEWAIVHLSYPDERETDPAWPSVEVIGDATEVFEFANRDAWDDETP